MNEELVDEATHHDPGPPARKIRLVVAWIAEDRELDHVVSAALDLGRREGARVVLYDHDTASALSDVLPNWWASQGERRQYGDPLDEAELVKLGLEPLARKVARARQEGVDAWGWPASGHGTEELVDYARDHGADVLLLPAEMDEPGLLDRLKGETVDEAVEEVEERDADLAILLVNDDGAVRPAGG
jgi:nucleotide-binding universal stress UspA family protein